MKYKVNEIFRSLQGEGGMVGLDAVFVRLSGCNLACRFCDTSHNDGIIMDDTEIVAEAKRLYPEGGGWIILTGGEPTIHDIEPLLLALNDAGFKIALETNGTNALSLEVRGLLDYITASPKAKAMFKIAHYVDELRLPVGATTTVADMRYWYDTAPAKLYLVSPVHDEASGFALTKALNLLSEARKAGMGWLLSMQAHKMAGIR